MHRWKVTIEAWPYSLPNMTRDEAQKLAGARSAEYEVEAQGFHEAVTLADAIVQGIRANPHVWRAPIVGLRQDIEVGG